MSKLQAITARAKEIKAANPRKKWANCQRQAASELKTENAGTLPANAAMTAENKHHWLGNQCLTHAMNQ